MHFLQYFSDVKERSEYTGLCYGSAHLFNNYFQQTRDPCQPLNGSHGICFEVSSHHQTDDDTFPQDSFQSLVKYLI